VSKALYQSLLLKKTLIFLLLVLIGQSAVAQDIAVFQDKRGHFFVFEKGVTSKLEFVDMQRDGGSAKYKIDGDRVIYANAQNYTIHYRNGEKKIMDYKDNYDRYLMSDGFIITTENDILSVVEGFEKKTISLAKGTPFAFGEEIVAFIDWDGRLKVYDGQETIELAGLDLTSLKASDTSAAWTDDTGQFMFWKDGVTEEISIELIQSYKVANNFVVYIDEYSSLKLFFDGVVMDLEEYAPASYRIGDDILAYINDQGDFKMFADDELKVLDVEPPSEYRIKENTMYYIDSRDFFKVYDSGEIHDMETYQPTKILMDEGVVAYVDRRGYLWAYYEGEKVKVSNEIVEDFEVQGRVITYWNNSRNAQIYWDGNRY